MYNVHTKNKRGGYMNDKLLDKEDKNEALEIAKAIEKLSDDEKIKIYYMIKGMELLKK